MVARARRRLAVVALAAMALMIGAVGLAAPSGASTGGAFALTHAPVHRRPVRPARRVIPVRRVVARHPVVHHHHKANTHAKPKAVKPGPTSTTIPKSPTTHTTTTTIARHRVIRLGTAARRRRTAIATQPVSTHHSSGTGSVLLIALIAGPLLLLAVGLLGAEANDRSRRRHRNVVGIPEL